jgi:uncharacterized protein (TIGR03435 family)
MYAMTIAPGGLNKARITTPVPGDCKTAEQYSAWAASLTVEERRAAGNPRLCGRAYSGKNETGFYTEYASVTLKELASSLSAQLDYAVVDRTGTTGPFNFTSSQTSSAGGTRDEYYARFLAELGLKLDLVKGPAEYLRIDSVQRLRPNAPAAVDSAGVTAR